MTILWTGPGYYRARPGEVLRRASEEDALLHLEALSKRSSRFILWIDNPHKWGYGIVSSCRSTTPRYGQMKAAFEALSKRSLSASKED